MLKTTLININEIIKKKIIFHYKNNQVITSGNVEVLDTSEKK